MKAPSPTVADATLAALAALQAFRLGEQREVLVIGQNGPWTFAALAGLADRLATEVDQLGGDSRKLLESIYVQNTT
jgi:hypothetical protein